MTFFYICIYIIRYVPRRSRSASRLVLTFLRLFSIMTVSGNIAIARQL